MDQVTLQSAGQKQTFTPASIGLGDTSVNEGMLRIGEMSELNIKGLAADIHGALLTDKVPADEAALVLVVLVKELADRARGLRSQYHDKYVCWHTEIDASTARAARFNKMVRGLRLPKETHR